MKPLPPQAPGWIGDLTTVTDDALWERDQNLTGLLAAILVHHNYSNGLSPYSPATAGQCLDHELGKWVRALVDVRNERNRRDETSTDNTTSTPTTEGASL